MGNATTRYPQLRPDDRLGDLFRGEPGAPFASIAPRARLPDTGLSMEADQERRPFDRVTEWLAHVPSSN